MRVFAKSGARLAGPIETAKLDCRLNWLTPRARARARGNRRAASDDDYDDDDERLVGVARASDSSPSKDTQERALSTGESF